AEPDVRVEGKNIIVDLPGVSGQSDAFDALKVSGIVELRPVYQCQAGSLGDTTSTSVPTGSTVPGATTGPGATTAPSATVAPNAQVTPGSTTAPDVSGSSSSASGVSGF